MEKCFADKNGNCFVLIKTQCEGCSFYQTYDNYRLGRKKAMIRLASLPKDLQEYINQKYFRGAKDFSKGENI